MKMVSLLNSQTMTSINYILLKIYLTMAQVMMSAKIAKQTRGHIQIHGAGIR